MSSPIQLYTGSPIAFVDRGGGEEISTQESLEFNNFIQGSYNPDTLVEKKGDLKIYQKMMIDEQIKASITLKKYSRLSTGWEIKQGNADDQMSKMLVDYVETVIKMIDGTFYDALLGILTAMEYGFSISEIVKELIDKGDFKGKIGLRKIATRQPFGYSFKTDNHGNLEGILFNEYAGTTGSDWGTNDKPLPPERFVIYSYNKVFSNHFGESDLRAVYRSWFSKQCIMKFYNIYLERYGSPLMKATTPANAGKKIKEAVDKMLKNLSAKSGIRLPPGVEVELLEATRAGHAGYDKAIELHNTMIARGILIPELMGFTGRNAGSQSLGEVQFDVFIYILEKLGRDIEETVVDEQIMRPLIDMNWADVKEDQYPMFQLKSLKPENVEMRAKILKTLADAEIVDANEPWIRDYLLLPAYEQPKEGEGPKKPKPDPVPVKEDPEKKPKEGETPKAKKPEEPEGVAKKSFVLESYALRRKPDQFEKKVGMDAFAKSLEATDTLMRDSLVAIFTKQRDKLLRDVEKNKVIEDKNYKFIDKLQLLGVGKVKATVQQGMVKAHLDSKLAVLEELEKGGLQIDIVNKFAAGDAPVPFQPWVPVAPAEAIDQFNKKVLARIVAEDGVKKLIPVGNGPELRYYDSHAFAVSGVERDYILKEAKFALQTGIKQGQATKEVMSNLAKIYDKYIPTGEIIDGKVVSPARLETVVRTNISDAVNQGRKAMMDNPLVKNFIPFVEWSSIIDDRTTAYCEDMDGKKFKHDDPLMEIPPAHFNCRSIIVPITMVEVERVGGIETDEITDIPRAKGFIWEMDSIEEE